MRKWKKILSAILAGAMFISAVGSFPAAAEEGTFEISDGFLHYEILEDGTAEITGFTQTTNMDWWVGIEIPEEIEGAAVTSIAANAFSENHSLISLKLPVTVTSIGENAFYNTYPFNLFYGGSAAQWNEMDVAAGNDNLLNAVTEYTIDGMNYFVLEDGSASLSGYDSAEGDIILPDTLEERPMTIIGSSAFSQNSLITSVTIPDSVTKIDEMAFIHCSELTEVILPDSLVSIEMNAFRKCTALTSIVLPESLEFLGDYAFKECTLLSDVTVPEDFTNFGSNAFPQAWLDTFRLDNGIAVVNGFVADGSACVGDVVIPDGVIGIADAALRNDNITSLTIPASVQYMGKNICYGNDNLTKVVLEEGLTTTGSYMFYMCDALTDLTLPSTLTSIGDYSFGDCTSLPEINLPDGLISIGNGAFIRCEAVKEIVLPDSLEYLGEGAFADIYLLSEIVIPDGVDCIGKNAFNGCIYLKNVVLPEGITEIQEGAFEDCTQLKEINIPESLTTIGNGAFRNTRWLSRKLTNDPCLIINNILVNGQNLSGVVDLPDTIHTINEYAFAINSTATRINIPDSVTTIGNYAFTSCSALEELYIPKSVTFIDYWAFHMSSLSTIYYEGSEEDWANIQLDDSNEQELKDITIIYGAGSGEEETYETGDIDGNNIVNLSDAQIILSSYAESAAGLVSILSASQNAAADLNGDGVTDLTDAGCILTYYAQNAAGMNPSWNDIIGA